MNLLGWLDIDVSWGIDVIDHKVRLLFMVVFFVFYFVFFVFLDPNWSKFLKSNLPDGSPMATSLKLICPVIFISSLCSSISVNIWPIKPSIEAGCSWDNALSIPRIGFATKVSVDEYIVAASRPFWLKSIDDGAEKVCPVTDEASRLASFKRGVTENVTDFALWSHLISHLFISSWWLPPH